MIESRLLLAAQLDAFLADLERQARPNTVSAYRSDLTLAAQYLTRPLDQIGMNDVVTFLSTGDVSATTRARRAASLKRFFAWAVQQGLLLTKPMIKIERVRLDDPAPRGLRREQIEAIFAVIPRQQMRDRLLFRLIYDTGLRVGEALGVHLEQDFRLTDLNCTYTWIT
ncbi:MAG: site-specific integrase [Chloroflexaceae bacterium]|nr:site-specific integrase [Chloroflexaceae bacterium]